MSSAAPARRAVPEEQALVADPLPRLGHPVGDGVLPPEVVLGLLVLREVLLRAVRLVQQEPGRVVFRLEHVEADVAGFFPGVAGVVEYCVDELQNERRLYEDGHGDDVHVFTPGHEGPTGHEPSRMFITPQPVAIWVATVKTDRRSTTISP